MKLKAQATPYDDVFRTLVTDLGPLVLPVLNELFGTNYRGDETILFQPNEHFLRQQDGKEKKRITDSSFRVIGKESRSYLLECQSTPDHSMLVRIFEYAAQIAVDESRAEGNRLVLEIPNAAVLFLRSTKHTPDLMEIELRTPGGDVAFTVPTLKVKKYAIEEIFMIWASKVHFLDYTDCSALRASTILPTFAIRGAPAPLLAHVGRVPSHIFPLRASSSGKNDF